MTGAAILAIVVATSELNDPATAIMIGAAGEALGSDVAIRLLGADQPEEADPLRIERETGAGAVVSLVWRDASRLRARVRLHVAASGHTTTRELVFAEADTRVERGRTLGLAAASMWPEIRAPAVAEAARSPAVPPPGAPPKTAEPGTAAPPAAPAPRPSEPSPASAAVPTEMVRAAPAARAVPGFALGLVGLGAAGGVRTVGARVESLFGVGGSWSLRAALLARTGPISALGGGTLWTYALAGGVDWWPAALRAGELARFGMRADAMAMRHQVSGAAAAGQSESRSRYLPAFDLMAQMALRASARIDLLAAVGTEAEPGGTDIRTGSPPMVATTIPVFQLVAEVGLRVGF